MATWVEAALDEEELLLARIAEASGAGMDPAAIARFLRVPVGLVLDVLRPPRPGGAAP